MSTERTDISRKAVETIRTETAKYSNVLIATGLSQILAGCDQIDAGVPPSPEDVKAKADQQKALAVTKRMRDAGLPDFSRPKFNETVYFKDYFGEAETAIKEGRLSDASSIVTDNLFSWFEDVDFNEAAYTSLRELAAVLQPYAGHNVVIGSTDLLPGIDGTVGG